MRKAIPTLEGLYEINSAFDVFTLNPPKTGLNKGQEKLPVFDINGVPSVSIKGHEGPRRHRALIEIVNLVNGVVAISDISKPRYATNAELVDRQVKLILPLLPRTDPDYINTLTVLLVAALGTRSLPCQ